MPAIYKSTYQSPLGKMDIESDGKNLIALYFEGQKYSDSSSHKETLSQDLAIFTQTKRWLDSYFLKEIPKSTPQLGLNGSRFSLLVWDILLNIPYGTTTSYAEIAKIIAKKLGIAKMSAQAVGGAIKRNKIAIIIPCHRVIGTNGSLTGYAAGIDRKMKLLELEGLDVGRFISHKNMPDSKKLPLV